MPPFVQTSMKNTNILRQLRWSGPAKRGSCVLLRIQNTMLGMLIKVLNITEARDHNENQRA